MDNLTAIEQRVAIEMAYFHECGHAIIATLFQVPVIEINMNIGSNLYPGVRIDTQRFNRLPIEKQLDFFMAGFASEKIYVLEVCKNPRHFAYNFAQKIFEQGIDDHIGGDVQHANEVMKFPYFKRLRIAIAKKRALKVLSSHKAILATLLVTLNSSEGKLDGLLVRNAIYSASRTIR